MPEEFHNKYRIPSARFINWDYRWNAPYFITICTQHREHIFGQIVNGKMELSSVGIIADILWYEIKNHTRNVELDAFVVMPNHIHGILIIKDDFVKPEHDSRIETDLVETLHATSLPTTQTPPAQTLHATSLPTTPTSPPSPASQNPKNELMATISPKSGSVSTIIRSYKSAVSKHAHRMGFDFAWQTRFHDHIIRDGESFQRIQSYIRENPMKWDEDEFKK